MKGLREGEMRCEADSLVKESRKQKYGPCLRQLECGVPPDNMRRLPYISELSLAQLLHVGLTGCFRSKRWQKAVESEI